MYSIMKDIIKTHGVLAAAEHNARHIKNILIAGKTGSVSRSTAAANIRRRRKLWNDVFSSSF